MAERARKRKPYRPQLRGQHRETYYYIARVIGSPRKKPHWPGGAPDMPPGTVEAVKELVTRLCALAGVPRRSDDATAFDDALKAVYMREGEAGFDPAPAHRLAEQIADILKPLDEEGQRKSSAWYRARHPAASLKRELSKPQARADELRERLQSLKDEGEAHNESGVFRLERELYDLERRTSDDEWPDWIPG